MSKFKEEWRLGTSYSTYTVGIGNIPTVGTTIDILPPSKRSFRSYRSFPFSSEWASDPSRFVLQSHVPTLFDKWRIHSRTWSRYDSESLAILLMRRQARRGMIRAFSLHRRLLYNKQDV